MFLRRLWGTKAAVDNHEKICSWLLESTVLEFNGDVIKHAQFDFAALHDACLSEMEGYVTKGSPYKSGITKEFRSEIAERHRIKQGIRNAKARSAANHKEYKDQSGTYGTKYLNSFLETPVPRAEHDTYGLFTQPTIDTEKYDNPSSLPRYAQI
jgi:hypothetical protein